MDCEKSKHLLESALRRYEGYFHESFDGEVYVLKHSEIKTVRGSLFDRLGAEFETFQESTLGETVYGVNGMAIVLYPFNIWNEAEFYHTIYHELGHFLLKKRNPVLTKKQYDRAYGTSELYGYTLIDEFIAESVANFLAQRSMYADESACKEEIAVRLYQALPGSNPEKTKDAMAQAAIYRQGIKVFPGALGLYCAMMLTDPILIDLMQNDPGFERGFSACNQQTIAIVEDIIEWFATYLNETSDYTFTEAQLGELGEQVLHLESVR